MMTLSRNGNYVWLTSKDGKYQSPALHLSDAEFFFNMGAEAQRTGCAAQSGRREDYFASPDFEKALQKVVQP